MKIIVIISSLFASVILFANADEPDNFIKALASWESTVSTESSVKISQRNESFSRLKGEWDQLSKEKKESMWPQLAMAYFSRSELDLAEGDVASAALALRNAGQLNREFGGRIEYSTKSPVFFFERLARLQTKIADSSKEDPLSGIVDYMFKNAGDHYIIARLERENEVNGITINGIGESEQLIMEYELKVQSDQKISGHARWLIGPKESIEKTVTNPSREVIFDKNGRLSIKVFDMANNTPDSSPIGDTSLVEKALGNTPKRNVSKSEPFPPRMDYRSLIFKIIVMMVSIIAIAFVWLAIKRRK